MTPQQSQALFFSAAITGAFIWIRQCGIPQPTTPREWDAAAREYAAYAAVNN